MALDKLVDSTQLDADITSIANNIRLKTGGTAPLTFPSGMIQAMTPLIDTSDADAAAGDILQGKTAYVNGEKVAGTGIAQSGTATITFASYKSYELLTDLYSELLANLIDTDVRIFEGLCINNRTENRCGIRFTYFVNLRENKVTGVNPGGASIRWLNGSEYFNTISYGFDIYPGSSLIINYAGFNKAEGG